MYAVWWALWIGPQQQSQPDGNSAGCDMRFPFNGNDVCPTNPLVTFSDITLRNVTSTRAINPYPGVIMMNVTNPGTNFVFDSVTFKWGADNKDFTKPYITSEVYGTVMDSSPIPDFKPAASM
jgi:hypothetical protein